MKNKNDLSVEIIKEIYRTVELLGGDLCILAYIGSFRDTMSDEETLNGIKEWNEGKTAALKRVLLR